MPDKKKEKIDWKIVCTGLVCLTGLEVYAISKGMNGWLLGICVAVIAGAIGVYIPRPKLE